MKKIISIILLVSCFLTACNNVGKNEVREPNEYEGGSVQSFSKYSMHTFSSIKELADALNVSITSEVSLLLFWRSFCICIELRR